MLRIHSIFEPLAVRQGAFMRGQAIIEDYASVETLRTFRWIYDCGATPTFQADVQDAISYLKCSWQPFEASGQALDLLVISHFDGDHISGLPELLRTYRFDRIILPFTEEKDRILLALLMIFENERSPSLRAIVSFLKDPVGYIARIDGQRFKTKIIFAQASEGVAENPSPLDGGGLGDGDGVVLPLREPNDSELQVLGMAGSSTNISMLQKGSVLSWHGLWELVPYVDPAADARIFAVAKASLDRIVGKFKRVVESVADDSISDEDIQGLIEDCRDDFYEAMARTRPNKERGSDSKISPKLKNHISVMVSCGPTLPSGVGLSTIRGHRYEEKRGASGSTRFFEQSTRGGVGSGLLLTGDGCLKTASKITSIVRFLTPTRVGRIGVLQLPHHGSIYDSCGKTDIELPAVYTFANACDSSHHPHEEVVMRYRNHERPFLVSDRNLHFCVSIPVTSPTWSLSERSQWYWRGEWHCRRCRFN